MNKKILCYAKVTTKKITGPTVKAAPDQGDEVHGILLLKGQTLLTDFYIIMKPDI
jgi:hypothetical protein